MPPRPSRPLARRLTPGAGSYWALARTPRHALVFALPLLLAYETLAAALGEITGLGVRNGADVWLKSPFALLFGARGPVLFGALVVGGAAVAVWRDVRRARDGVQGRVLLGMLAESVVMAVVCALVVGAATALLLRALPGAATVAAPALAALADDPQPGGLATMGAPARLMIALGAGLYEELLFRVVLVGALLLLARRVLGLGTAAANTLAVLVGALVFSAFHHVGPYGEPFTLAAFGFRAIAGLFFSALYVLRGFGIAAWTHALYDVGVLMT
jgi:hypothetical protein